MSSSQSSHRRTTARILVLAWTALCAGVGTAGLALLFSHYRTTSEFLFPVYLVLWIGGFFAGRAILRRFVLQQPLVASIRPPESGIQNYEPNEIRKPLAVPDRLTFHSNPTAVDVILPCYRFEKPPTQSDISHSSMAFRSVSPSIELVIHRLGAKNHWKAFRVLSEEKILQGIVAATSAKDLGAVDDIDALLNELLQRTVLAHTTGVLHTWQGRLH